MTSPIKRLRPHLRHLRRSRLVRVAAGMAVTIPALTAYDASWYWELLVGGGTGYVIASWAWKPYEMIQDRVRFARRILNNLLDTAKQLQANDPDGAVKIRVSIDTDEGLVYESIPAQP